MEEGEPTPAAVESVVVDAEPAAEGDGAGAAETATDAVMDTGHSSDEDSLPPTPVEATPATEGTTEENRGEEGADGGEAEAETAVKNDAAGAEADTEADADADTDGVASPTDATDPQVQKFVDGWKESISAQEKSRQAVLGWLSRAFPSDPEEGATAASGAAAAADGSGDRVVLNAGYDSN